MELALYMEVSELLNRTLNQQDVDTQAGVVKEEASKSATDKPSIRKLIY